MNLAHSDRGEQAFEMSMALKRGKISEEHLREFEGYMAKIFSALGMDLNTPGTVETPRRFVQALFDATEATMEIPSCSVFFRRNVMEGQTAASAR